MRESTVPSTSAHEEQLAYHGHVLMENRHGLAVGAMLTTATGTAERDAVRPLLRRHLRRRRGRRTLGADKGYDTRGAVAAWRAFGVMPHVAQNTSRPGGSAIDARTIRHPGYAVSQYKRKRIEEIFGWLKTIGLQRQTRFRGPARVAWMFIFATPPTIWSGCIDSSQPELSPDTDCGSCGWPEVDRR